MELFLSILLLVVVTLVTYWFLTRPYTYWAKQHVPALPDPVPVFGHMLPMITLKKNMSIFSINAYKKTNASAIGFYFLQTPGLIPRDPELVKSVLQTHFNSFHNNGFHLDEKADPVFSKNPFFATDLSAWKTARTRTGSHLTGKKLRHLFVIINEVCSKMDNYIDRKIKETNGSLECELKETFVKYTGEIVANAALGVQGQSFRDEPDQLSFTNVVKLLFAPTLINGIKQALLFYVPRVGNFLKVSLLEQKADSYFRENIRAVLKERTMSNVAPNDYLQFCINSNGEREIDSIIADVLIFYGDVYETSSTTLATLFYFLSQNKNVQVKLRQHILDVLKKNNGVVTYELLKDMNYLDQVIFETMRILTPLGTQFKECTKEITLMGSDGLKFHLKPGHLIFIPVSALHMDETYWPEPETFDPDRFSPENVASRHRFVYLAFGEGPRMCIGIRLGMMLVKIAAVNLLIKYSVENSEKTRKPLEYDPASLMMYIKGGLWGRFERLNPNDNH